MQAEITVKYHWKSQIALILAGTILNLMLLSDVRAEEEVSDAVICAASHAKSGILTEKCKALLKARDVMAEDLAHWKKPCQAPYELMGSFEIISADNLKKLLMSQLSPLINYLRDTTNPLNGMSILTRSKVREYE